jgi:phosphate transport system permease protein
MTDTDQIQDARARRRGRLRTARLVESFVRGGITASGWTAIAILAAIAAFLTFNSWQALTSPQAGLLKMLTGSAWYPSSDPPTFGFLPYIMATARVTGVALLVAVPLGLAATVYISEFAPHGLKGIARSIVEFMAAVPSVVYGLLGVYAIGPAAKSLFHMQSALSALSAGLVLSLMALPTIIAISEDAMHAVPKDLRFGSLALGNTRWQTAYKVVVPAAGSGIFASVMLGMGRAIGETMVVLMVAGNSMEKTWSLTTSARPLTSVIAGEMGEVVQGGLHYSALFVVGLTLFAITFAINLAADIVLERQRQRWRR